MSAINNKTKSNQATKFIIFKTIVLLCYSQAFAANQFADTPLYLHNKSITRTSSGAKPNITFFIDDSGSMSHRAGTKSCSYRFSTCISKNPNNPMECKTWGPPGPWSEEKVPYGSITVPLYFPDDPPEKIQKIEWENTPHCEKAPKRLDVVKNVLKLLVNTYRNDFYYSLQPLNGYKRKVSDSSEYNNFYNTEKENDYDFIMKHIEDLKHHGGTPILERLTAVTRNTVMNKLKYRCQKSYLILLSDGESHRDAPITDSTLSRQDRDYGYDGYFDGDRVRDNSMFSYSENRIVKALQYYTDTLLTKSFGNYIYTKPLVDDDGDKYIKSTKHSDRRLTDDAGQPWDEPDPLAGSPGHSQKFTQTAQTFTIGFGLNGNDPSDKRAIEFLRLGASPKPDYDPVTNPYSRYFFNATEPEDVSNAFQNIFKEIKTQTEVNKVDITTHSPMMGESSTVKKNLLIKAKINTADWSSQLCFHDSNETKDEKNACNKQPTFSNRKLVLNNGQNSYLYSNAMSDFTNSLFKITDNENLNKLEWRDGLLNWLSRSSADANIKQSNFVLDYRQRNNGNARNMGDMINNSIEAIGDAEFGKQKYLVTSANDGMVYVFRATDNNNNPYDLKFNYMPMAIERDSTDGSSDLVSHYYKDLTSNAYGKDNAHPHRYLLNGGFTVVETPNQMNRPKQIFMVSNMGQAGRGAFAINIGGKDLTNKTVIAADNLNNNNWYKDLFLFQTPTGSGNGFGYTVGTPMVAITRVNREKDAPNNTYTNYLREAAFINNGFNFPGKEITDNESALYIYDVLGVDVGQYSYNETGDAKGTLIKKLTADGKGGLAGPVVYDINNDGVADLVYAGDYGGNLYRFDIRDPNPNNWKVTKIFTAEGPITAAPALFAADDDNSSHKVIVVFGTGSDLYQSDLESKKQQAIYGIYDDYDQNNLVTKDDLLQQTMLYNGNNGQLSKLPLSSSHKGWYFKLNTDGERVTTSISHLLSTGVVMTTTYDLKRESNNAAISNDPCKTQKTSESTTILSRLTQFDTRTGGQLGDKSPRVILLQNTNTFASSVGVAGLVGLRISTINQYDYLNAGKSGQQKIPGKISPPQKCFRKGKEPHVDLSNGDGTNLGNIPICDDYNFKRLSWREIKPEYVH